MLDVITSYAMYSAKRAYFFADFKNEDIIPMILPKQIQESSKRKR